MLAGEEMDPEQFEHVLEQLEQMGVQVVKRGEELKGKKRPR